MPGTLVTLDFASGESQLSPWMSWMRTDPGPGGGWLVGAARRGGGRRGEVGGVVVGVARTRPVRRGGRRQRRCRVALAHDGAAVSDQIDDGGVRGAVGRGLAGQGGGRADQRHGAVDGAHVRPAAGLARRQVGARGAGRSLGDQVGVPGRDRAGQRRDVPARGRRGRGGEVLHRPAAQILGRPAVGELDEVVAIAGAGRAAAATAVHLVEDDRAGRRGRGRGDQSGDGAARHGGDGEHACRAAATVRGTGHGHGTPSSRNRLAHGRLPGWSCGDAPLNIAVIADKRTVLRRENGCEPTRARHDAAG